MLNVFLLDRYRLAGSSLSAILHRGAVLILLISLAPANAGAGAPRIRLAPISDKPLSGAVACFARASLSGSVLAQMLSTPGGECIPLEQIISLPPGVWMFHAEVKDPLSISTHPFKIRQSQQSSETGEVRRIQVPLSPAAFLDIDPLLDLLAPDERPYLWVENPPAGAPHLLIPIDRAKKKILAPIGMPVRVIATRATQISRITDELVLRRGDELVVREFSARPVEIIPVGFREIPIREVEPPIVQVIDIHSNTHVLSFTAPSRGLIFMVLPDGEFKATVDDTEWESSEVRVRVRAADALMITDDLLFSKVRAETRPVTP